MTPSPDPLPERRPHPVGLYIYSATEVMERAAYYGMLALLAMYAWKVLKLSETEAYELVGTYTGCVYLAALPGGILAGLEIGKTKRKLGYVRAVFIGGILMIVGHAVMAIGTLAALYAAMGFISVGNGLFKPSIASLVRKLYAPGDPRLDDGLSIFYLSVNIGAFLAPFIVAAIRARWGWHAAFGSAGVGLAIGMAQLALTKRFIGREQNDALGMVVEYAEKKPMPWAQAKGRVFAICLLSATAVFFFMAFSQNATTMVKWTDTCVERMGVPTEMYEAANPLFILIFTPILALMLRRVKISTPVKIAIGMALTAVAYLLLWYAAWKTGDAAKAHMGWVIGSYAVITIGELLVSPHGLGLVLKLAPPRWVGAMAGLWYVSTAAGNKLGGKLGHLWVSMPHAKFFSLLVATSLMAGVFMWARRHQLQQAIEEALAQDAAAVPAKPQAVAVSEPPAVGTELAIG